MIAMLNPAAGAPEPGRAESAGILRPARGVTTAVGGERVPLVEVSVDLAPGMIVQMDRCVGDVPVLEVVTGRARLVISADAGDVRELDGEDVALAEAFAAAACELRDEFRRVVELHRRGRLRRVS